MGDTNHPDYFPELRFHTFESYAHKWAEARDEDYNFDLRYPFINRIILYRVPVAYDYKQKYLLFFELSEITDEHEKQFPQMLENPDWLISCFGESENNFSEIYKKAPDQNYINEWVVVTKRPEDVVKKHSWMLFSRIKENVNNYNGCIKKKVLPCSSGTKWKDVKITLISNEAVMIETPNGSGRYHFSELSMKDGRTGDTPTILWELLMYFCEYSGRVTSETRIDRIQNLSKSISDLNKKLKNIFGIDEKFCHKYEKRDGWVTKCIFDDKTEV